MLTVSQNTQDPYKILTTPLKVVYGGHLLLPPTLPREILVYTLLHGHPPADQLRNQTVFRKTFVKNVIFVLCSLSCF